MKNSRKTIALVLLVCLLGVQEVWAFCGFYVAKAGAELFNNKSQVIIVRDGNRNVITMANDFKGNVKDFAMVVPVPVVLNENDIKVVGNELFAKLDAYSAPRMVKYYDPSPCIPVRAYEMEAKAMAPAPTNVKDEVAENVETDSYRVTIEARYSVEEYDILILSAEESGGLKRWLFDNGYSIPAKAEEVLEPYIKSNLKFFVVKVNLEKQKALANGYLRPLQIRFEHEKFMLPIRLGMANAQGEQDMLVYAFTRKGRIETANYRTVKIPTDKNIPLYVQQRFDRFYADLFTKSYKREERNAVFLEYAWDLSPRNYMKCDPCVGEVPDFSDMATAGVDWIMAGSNDLDYNASVFFTRLHVRYTRDKFPQDLTFIETPNRENFQGRYIITIPGEGPYNCDAGQKYLGDLRIRRLKENMELAALTGWDMNQFAYYVKEYDDLIKSDKIKEEIKQQEDENNLTPTFFDNGKGSDTPPRNDGNHTWKWLFYFSLCAFMLVSAYNIWQILMRNARRGA